MTTTNICKRPGEGIARVSTVDGYPSGEPKTCVACGELILAGDDYLTLWAPRDRGRRQYAVAHQAVWVGPGDDDYDHRCTQHLRAVWDRLLGQTGAARLTRRCEDGGPRFYAGEIALHAGSRLEVLTGDDQWLQGRFEYQPGPSRWTPQLYVLPAGFAPSAQPYQLATDNIIRIPVPDR